MTSLTTHSSAAQKVPGATDQPTVRFSLDVSEEAGAGLHRILIEQTELGAWHMERARLSDYHVHEVRKATKRVRAVLRMVRDDIEPMDYVRLNAEVRDLARDLSELRSAVVQVDLLESVVADDEDLRSGTRGIHGRLVDAADDRREGLADSMIRSLSQRFESVRADTERIQFVSPETRSLGGIQRTYRRGRRSMGYAYADPTVESFHIWRKQVKYLRHQMEILQSGARPDVTDLVSDLEEIGEGLGMDHDLADLQRATADVGPDLLTSEARSHLINVIEAKRVEVQHGLRPLAARVFTVKPSTFAQQVMPSSD